MSKSIRSYPEAQRPTIVRRRLGMLLNKDFKPGLGTLAAMDYNSAIARKSKVK